MSIEHSQNTACIRRSGPGPLGPVRKILVVRSGPEGPQFSRSVGTLLVGDLISKFVLVELTVCSTQLVRILHCTIFADLEKIVQCKILTSSASIFRIKRSATWKHCCSQKLHHFNISTDLYFEWPFLPSSQVSWLSQQNGKAFDFRCWCKSIPNW